MNLPLVIGGGILAATTNATILATGGYLTSHAPIVVGLAAGVFAAANVIGQGRIASRGLVLAIVGALVAGEAYNLVATAERLVVAREAMQAPLKDLSAKRTAALDRLKALETGEATSTQLTLAKQALVAARAAVDAEAKDIRCGKECKRKQDLADRAEEAVKAAIPGAVAGHAKAVESAKADVAANPLPASATALADRLGLAPWVLDLAMAALLSVAANGLAGVLIAFGSQVPVSQVPVHLPVPFQVPFSPVPPRGTRNVRSGTQAKANMIAKELRDKGEVPLFRIVRNEFQRRYGTELPKVTAHRACG